MYSLTRLTSSLISLATLMFFEHLQVNSRKWSSKLQVTRVLLIVTLGRPDHLWSAFLLNSIRLLLNLRRAGLLSRCHLEIVLHRILYACRTSGEEDRGAQNSSFCGNKGSDGDNMVDVSTKRYGKAPVDSSTTCLEPNMIFIPNVKKSKEKHKSSAVRKREY